MDSEEVETCRYCGGDKHIRNPTGACDHLYWPDMLTDEAKSANGYVRRTVEVWELPANSDNEGIGDF